MIFIFTDLEWCPQATEKWPPPSSFCSQAEAVQLTAGLKTYLAPGVRPWSGLQTGAPRGDAPSAAAAVKGSAEQTGGTARSGKNDLKTRIRHSTRIPSGRQASNQHPKACGT